MSTENKTENLKLPQYKPTDVFDLKEVNDGYKEIDRSYKEINDNYNKAIETSTISGAIDNLELIDARGGEAKLKDRLNKFDSSLDSNTQQINDVALNIKSFGAKGDGITDDTEIFKQAIIEVSTKTIIKSIFIPKGTYIITDTIEIPSGVKIYGVSRDRSRLIMKNINKTLFKCEKGGLFIEIKDLALYGDLDYTTDSFINDNNGIECLSPFHILIENVDIRKFGNNAIKITQSSGYSTGVGVNIINSYIKNNCGNGIYIERTHGITIRGGAVEYNKGWNILLGNECMETNISEINCNTGTYSKKGSVKTQSDTSTLDTLNIKECHFEANGNNVAYEYLVEIISNNFVIENNYFRSTPNNSLGCIKACNQNGEIRNNIFRNSLVGIKVTQVPSSNILNIIQNTFDNITTQIDGTGCNRFNIMGNPTIVTQDIIFNFTQAKTIAIRPPRDKMRLYSASILVRSTTNGLSFGEGAINISKNSDMTELIYKSPANVFNKTIGGIVTGLNLPTTEELKMLYMQISYIGGSERNDFELRLEWC